MEYIIEGRVLDKITKKPISGAKITAGNKIAYTNASGYYKIALFSEHSLFTVLKCEAEGYSPARKGVFLSGQAPRVTVDFYLEPTFSLSLLIPLAVVGGFILLMLRG